MAHVAVARVHIDCRMADDQAGVGARALCILPWNGGEVLTGVPTEVIGHPQTEPAQVGGVADRPPASALVGQTLA